jgi:hypothetical protein
VTFNAPGTRRGFPLDHPSFLRGDPSMGDCQLGFQLGDALLRVQRRT